jgi:UPF0755 protein
MSKKVIKRIAIISAATVALVAIILFFRFFTTYLQNNTVGKESYIYIPRETTWKGLLDSLNTSGRIKNMSRFERAAISEGLSESVKPGRYLIEERMNNRTLVRMIKFGWQKPVRLTISGNIRSLEKLSSLLAKKLEFDSVSMINTLLTENLADTLGFNNHTIISIFLPNTYEVYWTITPLELMLRMKREYDRFWNSERQEKAHASGLTPVEVIILASIVSQESNIYDEQPVIAGVYMNRLRKGIPLQADPTVKFAVGNDSLKRILYKHLKVDSPYNTYLHKGLPPGPIVIPSLKTIDAVLNYQKTDYMYFCAKPSLDGSHNFSTSLSGHNANAAAYRRAILQI